jgi:hypothetical protein
VLVPSKPLHGAVRIVTDRSAFRSAVLSAARAAMGRCTSSTVLPLAPISALRVTSGRPWIRWAARSGVHEVRVEVCATRDCARPVLSWDATGTSTRVPTELAPGVYYWRVRELAGYDDLLVTFQTGRVLYRGGPLGLSADDCRRYL